MTHTSGELLILGEPGVGKTTQLLNLARELQAQAIQDERHHLPVIINLSSWANKRQPLQDWLIEEVAISYNVSRRPIAKWIEDGQLIRLLDGLDEVPRFARPACIEAINAFHREHLVPVVVCSRSEEYLRQKDRLALQRAVVVQPLDEAQVDTYLKEGGAQLAGVRSLLYKNMELRELVTTPLLLHVLTLAYQGVSVRDLSRKGSISEQQRLVLDQYVQRMIEERRDTYTLPAEQISHWLTWLAKQMQKYHQTVFYLEQVQPNWLAESKMRRIYGGLAIQIPAILIGVLVSIVVNGVIFGQGNITLTNVLLGVLLGRVFGMREVSLWLSEGRQGSQGWCQHLASALINGIIVGLAIGISYAIYVGRINSVSCISSICNKGQVPDYDIYTVGDWLHDGLISGGIFGLGTFFLSIGVMRGMNAKKGMLIAKNSWRDILHRLVHAKHVRNALLVGTLIGLGAMLSNWLGDSVCNKLCVDGGIATASLSMRLFDGLVKGLQFSLIGGLLSIILAEIGSTVQPVEVIVWSWSSAWRGLTNRRHINNGMLFASMGIIVGLAFGLANGLRFGWNWPTITDGLNLASGEVLSNGLLYGLGYWLLIGLFRGMSNDILEKRHRVVPNQGIHNSVRNSLLIGFISMLVVWVISLLSQMLYLELLIGSSAGNLQNELGIILFFGVLAGILAGLVSGGIACYRHVILRLLLWRVGNIPWNYPRFLNEAAHRILLVKDGGGFRFIHRLFLDYFASLEILSPRSPRDRKP